MSQRSILFAVAALVLGLFIGFYTANRINRSEIESLRAKGTSANSASVNASDQSLTPEEIDQTVAQADKNSGDFKLQKNLGLALYRYGAMQKNADLIEKASKIIERANTLDPTDQDVLMGLANATFDLGFFRSDQEALTKARGLYEAAARSQPKNGEIQAEIGLTYYLQKPPDLAKASEAFARSVALEPTNKRALQYAVQTAVRSGDNKKADEYYARLKTLEPATPAFDEIKKAAESGSEMQQ